MEDNSNNEAIFTVSDLGSMNSEKIREGDKRISNKKLLIIGVSISILILLILLIIIMYYQI